MWVKVVRRIFSTEPISHPVGNFPTDLIVVHRDRGRSFLDDGDRDNGGGRVMTATATGAAATASGGWPVLITAGTAPPIGSGDGRCAPVSPSHFSASLSLSAMFPFFSATIFRSSAKRLATSPRVCDEEVGWVCNCALNYAAVEEVKTKSRLLLFWFRISVVVVRNSKVRIEINQIVRKIQHVCVWGFFGQNMKKCLQVVNIKRTLNYLSTTYSRFSKIFNNRYFVQLYKISKKS